MGKSVLVVVHPGFWANEYSVPKKCRISGRYLDVKEYGDYYAYRSNLAEAVRSNESVVLFLYKEDEIPAELGRAKHVIRDSTGRCHIAELVDLLRKENAETVILCGELVWHRPTYTLGALVEYSKGLPEKGKTVTGLSDFLKYKEIIRDGCVTLIYRNLHVYRDVLYANGTLATFFEIKVDRGSCYPTVEATKKSFEGVFPSHRYDFFLKAR